jgi:hypothetical protein
LRSKEWNSEAGAGGRCGLGGHSLLFSWYIVGLACGQAQKWVLRLDIDPQVADRQVTDFHVT